MEQHIKTLGILNIVWGSLGAFCGVFILILFGGAYGIVEAVSVHEPDAALALPIIGIVGGSIAVLMLLVSVPSIIAGIGLLQFKYWAKILTIIISVLHLFNFPLGTALGIYGLVVMCSSKSRDYFVSN
ncbi:MAG: hypothetical protein JXR49_03625 [Acidobacteria bacterium]|nr:hypothetical protein [Acidobacteriota bacterium]